MDFEQLTALAYKMMGSRKTHLQREVGSVYYHGQRTAKLVQSLRRAIFPDREGSDDVLRAAAMFHDVGKTIDPHPHYGALIAREALKGFMSGDELEDVARLISAHEFRGDPARPWDELLLQDADMLDHFGTYELWTCIQYLAKEGGCLNDALALYRDDYPTMIAKNRALINFDQTRDAFDSRYEELKGFLARMEAENEGAL